MKKCKIIRVEGKNISDYAEQINTMLRGGWTLQGSLGKSNMLLIFSRNINVTEEAE